MKIKSIQLKNFRQFIDEKIEFSMDRVKNITLIRGDNTGGKTTLANAITWCLFGQYNFDKEDNAGSVKLVNKKVWRSATPNTKIPVTVILEIIKGETLYTIETTQYYKTIIGIGPKAKMVVQEDGFVQRKISYMDEEFETQTLYDTYAENKIAELFPQGLSEYLVLRAEQIKNMVNSIASSNLKPAVDKLLGIDIADSAASIINKAKDNINKAYIASAKDDMITKKQAEINKVDELLKDLADKKVKQENLMLQAQNTMEDETRVIKSGEAGQLLQNKIDNEKSNISSWEQQLLDNDTTFYKDFSKNIVTKLYTPLLEDLIAWLENAKSSLDSGLSDIYIPGVNKETIDKIQKRKVCICGRPFMENDEAWEALENLRSYVPPESLGAVINSFRNNIETKIENITNNQDENLSNIYNLYAEKQEKLHTKITMGNNSINKWNADLGNFVSIRENIARRDQANEEYTNAYIERNKILNQITEQVKIKKNLEADLQGLIEQSKGNELLKRKKFLIEKVASKYLEINKENKNKIHDLLTEEINKFFQDTFTKDYKIILKPDYSIKLVDKNDEITGGSGAQHVSVVLAFITSLLKISKLIHYNDLNEVSCEVLLTEPYPLVLDAPFSDFDRTRISYVAPKLSSLTEQIIVFSKDLEFDCIKENTLSKIGKLYTLKFETRIEDGQEEVWSTNVCEGDVE